MAELTFGQQLGLGSLGAGSGLLSTFLNMAQTNKWNKIQMEREDNAVQRRMADLEKAGINPLLAGDMSGASSGGYSTPTFDTDIVSKGMEALERKYAQKSMDLQLKNQIEDYKQNQYETDLFKKQVEDAEVDSEYRNLEYYGMFGRLPSFSTWSYGKDGKRSVSSFFDVNRLRPDPYSGTNAGIYLNDLTHDLEARYYESLAGRDYNKWVSEYQTPFALGAEKTIDMLSSIIPGASSIANAFANVYRSTRGVKTFNYNNSNIQSTGNNTVHFYRHPSY